MKWFSLCLTLFGFAVSIEAINAQDYVLHSFERQQLTDTYFSEGANFGDINRDGKLDAIHGPYWWQGPEFKVRREIFAPKPQNRDGYSTNFFTWVYDFTGDGWNDLVSVGLPGSAAVLSINPGEGKVLEEANHWQTQKVHDGIGNESPQFVNLVDDKQPELVCNHNGKFGYLTFDVKKPTELWTWHIISEQVGEFPFGHGLGVGDVNGDGRADVIWKGGWYEQPKSLDGDPLWTFHKYQFAGPGGADMFAYDVDGDGDNDVITSLAAHTFGLAWYEQVKDGDKITFKKHLIMGDKAEDNAYGVLFTEPHAVELHDMDGDGLKDIVTGKTYWSHHRQSPMWDAGAVVYWFKLSRGGEGERGRGGDKEQSSTVDWIPYLADGESGIGRQLNIADVDGDKLPDIIAGGMVGAHVLRHRAKKVSKEEWLEAQPLKKKPVAMADGLSPQEAAKQMTVPPGFKASLVAGEPLVHQPVAFTFDSRGRIWVAEAYTYPNRAKEGEGKDKIVILEDKDGDGYHETRKVFIEGLNLVSGLELGFGGVWVGAAPYLMFIPDRDGDDVPDAEARGGEGEKGRGGEKQKTTNAASPPPPLSPSPPLQFPKDVPAGATVLLDGFGWQDTHETLNAFIWGPDGWLYGCHGVFTHSKVGKPGTPAEQRQGLNAGVWRYHPTKHVFEVFAHGSSNPWGVDFNEHGHAFITACVIPHLYHIIQGGKYQRQGGQHFDQYFFEDIKTIADHQHYVGNLRDHAWWGHEPHAPTDTLSAGGGHAHAGAMIYLGDNFPPQYRNTLFMSNIHGNRVNQDVLVRKGSGYVGKHGKDLLVANDRWFRGINLKTGPDGSVYVIDWYDKNACHRTNSEIWDRTNGRIYNVKYVGHAARVPEPSASTKAESKTDAREPRAPQNLDLAKLSDAELVDLQLSPSEWHVRMARRLIQERAANGSLSEKGYDYLWTSLFPFPQKPQQTRDLLRLLWTWHVVVAAGNDEKWSEGFAYRLLDLQQHADEHVRCWAIQLAFENGHVAEQFINWMGWSAATDKSPLVRLYVASALQRLPLSKRWGIATALLSHAEDGADHNLPLMYWYGIEPLVAAAPSEAMQLLEVCHIPRVTRFLIRRAALDGDALNVFLEAFVKRSQWLIAVEDAPKDIESASRARKTLFLDELLAAFEGRVNLTAPPAWQAAYDLFAKDDDAAIRDKADQIAVIFGDQRILPRLRALLSDAKVSQSKRQQALDILVRGRDKDAAPAFQAAVADTALRGAAIRALSAYDHEQTPAVVLAQYAKLNEAEKRDAINTLCTRPSYAAALLDAIEKEKLPRTDLHAYNVQALLRFNDEKLQARIKSVWGEFRATAKDKQELIAKHKTNLTPARVKNGDLSNGRRLFSKTCQSCHTLFGEGQKVGPDITGSNRANLDYILENMLDPSAIVGKDYRATIIETKNGQVVSGLIQKETDSAITLRTINDTIVVAKADIEERKLSELSIMPEGQLNTLTPGEVRDLVAYLGSPTQVALRGPKSPIDSKSGKVPDALEGESLKILKVSAGNAAPQKMGGFSKDKWSGDDQLWWTGGKKGARLDLELPIAADGVFALELVLTKARDYGIVQVRIDDETLGSPIDGFNNPDVITTGVMNFEPRKLTKGLHKLTFEIVGKHTDAVGFMVGVDYVRLVAPASK
ncbi:MAG: PVC-type heme-binding CxxCH protein [Planctomycetaceae bacterium]